MRLLVLWLWFTSLLVPMACLDQPTLAVTSYRPYGAQGAYLAGTVMVWGSSPVFDRVAVHEFGHHFVDACHLDRRPIGRRFLRATGQTMWTIRVEEQFVETLVWRLTGSGSPYVRREAGWVFDPKLAGTG